MAYVSLLWEDLDIYIKCTSNSISEQVFEDLKLKELFSKLYSEEQIKVLLDVMRFPCSSSAIRYRQDILDDFMISVNNEFFSEVYSKLSELKQMYSIYSSQDQEYLKAADFSYVISLYQNLIKFIAHKKAILNFKSQGVSLFFNFFNDNYQSDIFLEASQMLETIKNGFVVFKNMKVDIIVEAARQVDYKVSLVKEEDLSSKLRSLSSALGFDISEDIQNNFLRPIPPTTALLKSMRYLTEDAFNNLMVFYRKYKDYLSKEIFRLQDEIQFYNNFCRLYSYLEERKIPYVKPEICTTNDFNISDCYDISLLCKDMQDIVPNEFQFNEDEHFYLLTGANGGGKTTYLRALGICQLLFSCGGYVPARYALMYDFSNIFTHFPSDERFDSVGRLKDEKGRADIISAAASERCLVLLNETFSSTDVDTSINLSQELLRKLMRKGASGVFVTHMHSIVSCIAELNLQENIISKLGVLTTVVDRSDSNRRLYKIIRTKPEHLSFAYDILKRYGLTKEQLQARFREVM